MCESYNDLNCDVVMSTVGNPDATFVLQKDDDELQFRGLELINGVLGVVAPNSILLSVAAPPAPISLDGTIGVLQGFSYGVLNPLLWPTEIPLSLLSTSYTTGLMAGNTVNVLNTDYYKISFNPTYAINGIITGLVPQVIFRIRNGLNVIFAEFYSKLVGNDEVTTGFSHTLFLPIGTYQFTIQVVGLVGLEYQQLAFVNSNVSVKRL